MGLCTSCEWLNEVWLPLSYGKGLVSSIPLSINLFHPVNPQNFSIPPTHKNMLNLAA